MARLNEPRQIALGRGNGYACHYHRGTSALSALGQRNAENARGLLSVFIKELVEVAHAIEQQRIGMLRLDAQVLLHHRGVLF
nr:hypothetical protein NCPCFENI_01238 [Cupriavidus sp.]